MNKKYIRITIIAMLCAIALIATDIILKYQHLERKSHEISEGFNTASQKRPIKMGMKSKTDTFKVDDVTFDIYYGMYEEGDETPDSSYVRFDSENVFFALYLYEYENRGSVIYNNGEDYKDNAITQNIYSKNIDKDYFVKEISSEEAFSDDYAYILDEGFLAADVEYKHNETITIMKELFSKAKGTIIIRIYAIVVSEGDEYRISEGAAIKINYEFISEDTVQIEYRHNQL